MGSVVVLVIIIISSLALWYIYKPKSEGHVEGDPCSQYDDKAINLSDQCLTELWRKSGCTTKLPTDTTLWKTQTKSKVGTDMKYWSQSSTPQFVTECQSQQQLAPTSRPSQAPSSCSVDQQQIDGQCYTSCPTGYDGTDATCFQKCPEGMRDDGKSCGKIMYGRGVGTPVNGCPDGFEKKGSLCYEKCPSGYHWLGLKCVKDCPPNYTDNRLYCGKKSQPRGVGKTKSQCPEGSELKGSLCYQKCPTGYHWFGLSCVKNCPTDLTDTGHHCTKKSYSRGVGQVKLVCPEGQEKKGELCYDKCPSGYHWLGLDCVKDCPSTFPDAGHHCTKPNYSRKGRIPDKNSCGTWNNQWRDDGTSCWNDAHIFGRVRAAGWNGKCQAGETKKCEGICGFSLVSCYKNCPDGYHNDGLTCRKVDVGIKKTLSDRQVCNVDEELITGLCYPKCRDGFKGVGPVCWGVCPSGQTDIGVSCQKNNPIMRSTTPKPLKCQSDQDEDAGLCYPKCQAGYNGVGPICWNTCPLGMTDIGVSCQKNGPINRAGNPQAPSCRTDQETDAGLCYPKCPSKYKGVGPVCWNACPSGMTDIGVSCQKNGTISRSKSQLTTKCPPDQQLDNGLCYPSCKDGYQGVGPTCQQTCPSEMTDNQQSCDKKTTTRTVSPLGCNSSNFPELIDGKCYGQCPEGYLPKATVSSRSPTKPA